MAVLHGNWLPQTQGGYLFIWGETWRRIAAEASSQLSGVSLHPLAMTPDELTAYLKSLPHLGGVLPVDALVKEETSPKKGRGAKRQSQETIAENRNHLSSSWRKHSQLLALPTHIPEDNQGAIYPVHSATEVSETTNEGTALLYPWQVEGFCLNEREAIAFLTALPLGSVNESDSFLGRDLRFWSHIARWSIDLLARCKFLPGINRNDNSAVASWQPVLDSAADRARLQKFAQEMPAACRTYQNSRESGESIAVNLPAEPRELLLAFLSSTIDSQLRTAIETNSPPDTEPLLKEWLQALGSESATLTAEAQATERLQATLNAWTAPLQPFLAGQSLFNTCFKVLPPASASKDWTLEYCLQAVDDPEFLVDATTIWSNPVERLTFQGRTIELPQETLLSGLGLASRLLPIIEPSLETPSPHSCRLNPLQAYEFIKNGAWRFQDSGLGVVLPPSLTNREGWASRLGLSISAQSPDIKKSDRLSLQSLLNFKWELSIGGQRLSKKEFDKLVALNTPLVEINGEWVELRPQDIKAAQTFFASRKEQMSLSLEDALRLSSGDSQTIEKLPVVSFEASGALQELISTLTGSKKVEAIDPPSSFKGELRPYQALGAGWLAFLERWGLGACLADDMGLGKTVELIAFLLYLQAKDALEKPTLIVCPTSVLGNWEREVKKFGPTLKVLVHHGDKRAKGKAFAKAVQDRDLVVTSYALAFRDAKDLQSVAWQGVILDEAQNIKNSEAKQSQAVRQLNASFRIALTGTPVENRLQELWSILDFLNPGYLGQRNFFQRRFAIPIEKYGDTNSLKTLRSLVQPFILRRLKTDREIIQDLPEKQEMTVFCGLTAEQAELYQKLVQESLAEIEESSGIQRRGMILALLVKLKQICNHPAQFLKQNSLGNQNRSAKLQRLEEMLEELISEGDRALIFTQFAEWGKLLKPHLEKQLGREVLFLYGSTTKNQREEMIDRFQLDPQAPRVMILSLKAGGVGLNLTRANHVFHFDRWWNPAVENQATDRAFRIGQKQNVQVHKFVCTGTLEEKIHDLIESKKALAEQVVGAGEQWLTELDTDQLRNLLLLDRTAVIDEEA
ncbi:DEAD/DEAH box helicase [Planktothrix sp. FACHB-1355]|uniref:DEAD/DEAH box helicase n=1 Tax=Aerosakkonema funiforme FACHB-1375 TaxID=2949571 RepID=A0A926VIN0_9CYAN|nr:MULTISPECIES: DEAD/DEAH box helicase [Oscillatoriales]MBD2184365.1 DEAD/DEAH box helicase [Aerosakkonema funiforme FACHB-1375]MBD3558835.1 DEAD/DEAH box helicase [Planktothrix sp. FACHB-1355]